MTDGVYFNEFDDFAAEWIGNLYPDAVVDRRDIRLVQPADVMGYRRCHFFSGIAGWEYALELAGWNPSRPVWTGSCPCQPFSVAGNQKGEDDERHLWPEFRRLIAECRPPAILGEQTSSDLGREWLAGVRADLEAMGYAVGAADLCAACEGSPHIRQRLWWVATSGPMGNAGRTRLAGWPGERDDDGAELPAPERAGGESDWLGIADGPRHQGPRGTGQQGGHGGFWPCEVDPRGAGFWDDFDVVPCRDGRFRRVESLAQQMADGPPIGPLAHGIPCKNSDPRLGRLVARMVGMGHSPKAARRIIRRARANRVGRLRGYGNAIVPEVAAKFIRAFLEAEKEAS